MHWKHPPIIKIYEALGAVADERVVVSGSTAKVYSSSGNKFYTVTYDPDKQAIMANDNGSYWKGYLGYSAIAFLLQIGVLELRPELAELLKGIAWKDINTKFKNDFAKTLGEIESKLETTDRESLAKYAKELDEKIAAIGLSLLGKKVLPPAGY